MFINLLPDPLHHLYGDSRNMARFFVNVVYSSELRIFRMVKACLVDRFAELPIFFAQDAHKLKVGIVVLRSPYRNLAPAFSDDVVDRALKVRRCGFPHVVLRKILNLLYRPVQRESHVLISAFPAEIVQNFNGRLSGNVIAHHCSPRCRSNAARSIITPSSGFQIGLSFAVMIWQAFWNMNLSGSGILKKICCISRPTALESSRKFPPTSSLILWPISFFHTHTAASFPPLRNLLDCLLPTVFHSRRRGRHSHPPFDMLQALVADAFRRKIHKGGAEVD